MESVNVSIRFGNEHCFRKIKAFPANNYVRRRSRAWIQVNIRQRNLNLNKKANKFLKSRLWLVEFLNLWTSFNSRNFWEPVIHKYLTITLKFSKNLFKINSFSICFQFSTVLVMITLANSIGILIFHL